MLSKRSLTIIHHAGGKVAEKVRDATARRLSTGKQTLATAGRHLTARYLDGARIARLEYGALLDGHTVNLCICLPAGIAPGDGEAWIELGSRGGDPRRVRARIRPSAESWHAECVILLGEPLGGLDLPAGRWSLSLILAAPSGEPRHTFPIRGETVEHARAGPTGVVRGCPITGARYRFGLSVSGRARIDVLPTRTSAELIAARLMLARGEMTVDVVGARSAPVAVNAVSADTRIACPPLPASGRDAAANRITAQIPFREMAALMSGGDRQTRVWTFEVGLNGGEALAVGRRLHDLRHPLRVFNAQELLVAVDRGVLARVRTGITRRGTFELFVTPTTAAPRRPAVVGPAPGRQAAS